jgi:hypothetical protein
MMNLKLSAIMAAFFSRLSSLPVSSLVGGRIYNHVPQTTPTFPYVRYFLASSVDWSDKVAQGLEQEVQVSIWSTEKGDLQVSTIADAVIGVMHNAELALPEGQQNILAQHISTTIFDESDGVTHHAVVRIKLISTST